MAVILVTEAFSPFRDGPSPPSRSGECPAFDPSAFSLAAVELRTDRHQHQENDADAQNDKAFDGL
jgi:hypothetical protein